MQTSTIDALLARVFDGEMTYGQLSQYGDFGIGTFNALDGEMIAFGGRSPVSCAAPETVTEWGLR